MESTLEDRIRRHAYFLWLDNNKTGDPTYFWLAAECAILAEAASKAEQTIDLHEATERRDAGSAAERKVRRVNALLLIESAAGGDKADFPLAAAE